MKTHSENNGPIDYHNLHGHRQYLRHISESVRRYLLVGPHAGVEEDSRW